MAVPAMGRAGFASGPLGLELRRSLGEGCGLAFGLALCLIEVGPGRVEFALEAFVLLAQVFILPAELLELGAKSLQFLQDAEGYGNRVEHLDQRHRDLGVGLGLNRYSAAPRRKRQEPLIKSLESRPAVARRLSGIAGGGGTMIDG